MKKSTIFACIGVGAAIAYFYARKQEGESSKGINGFNIDINTDRLMSGTMAYMGVNPLFQEPIKNVANKVLTKIIG